VGDSLDIDTATADRVARSLGDAAEKLTDPSTVLATLAQRIATDATGRVPRATGTLAGSLSVSPGTVEGRPAQTLTWGVRYAPYVNFGTRHMRARPFATDALDATAADAEPLLRGWAETILNGV
jgi:HK97 gp10 family phage protein